MHPLKTSQCCEPKHYFYVEAAFGYTFNQSGTEIILSNRNKIQGQEVKTTTAHPIGIQPAMNTLATHSMEPQGSWSRIKEF